MTSDLAWNEPHVLQELIATKPLVDVLAWLNERTEFRFTAMGRLTDGAIKTVAHVDRMGLSASPPAIPLPGSYFEPTLRDGRFIVGNALRDERLSKSAYRKLIRSYHGVAISEHGNAIGVLYHYDVLPHALDDTGAQLLIQAAEWLAPLLAQRP